MSVRNGFFGRLSKVRVARSSCIPRPALAIVMTHGDTERGDGHIIAGGVTFSFFLNSIVVGTVARRRCAAEANSKAPQPSDARRGPPRSGRPGAGAGAGAGHAALPPGHHRCSALRAMPLCGQGAPPLRIDVFSTNNFVDYIVGPRGTHARTQVLARASISTGTVNDLPRLFPCSREKFHKFADCAS